MSRGARAAALAPLKLIACDYDWPPPARSNFTTTLAPWQPSLAVLFICTTPGAVARAVLLWAIARADVNEPEVLPDAIWKSLVPQGWSRSALGASTESTAALVQPVKLTP